MTIFDMDNLNPSQWFEMKDGGRVCLRVCAGGDLRAIIKQTDDDEKQNELMMDFCIVGWEDLFDAKKKPIPCTKENKLLLINKSLRFSRFVDVCLKKLLDAETANEKN